MSKTTPISIDLDIVKDAKSTLERQPQNPEQLIEHWARLGKAVSKQLNETEQILVLLGNSSITVTEKSRD